MSKIKTEIKTRKIKKGEYTEWVRGENRHDFLVCENPKYAKVVAIMISKLKKFHDEIMFVEQSQNVIVVPVLNSKEIYLHEEYRPKVMKANKKTIDPYKFDESEIRSLGRWSFEVPRGSFDSEKDKDSKDAAKREVEEETDMKLKRKNLKEIGRLNFNTAYATSTMPVYMAICNKKDLKKEEEIKPEEKEKIGSRDWYSIKDVKEKIGNGEIFCGVTLAALNLALQKLDKRPDRDGSVRYPKKPRITL